jgi:hypothetical protein
MVADGCHASHACHASQPELDTPHATCACGLWLHAACFSALRLQFCCCCCVLCATAGNSLISRSSSVPAGTPSPSRQFLPFITAAAQISVGRQARARSTSSLAWRYRDTGPPHWTLGIRPGSIDGSMAMGHVSMYEYLVRLYVSGLACSHTTCTAVGTKHCRIRSMQ